jgi:hypothetical protein
LKVFLSGKITDYPKYISHFGRMESYLKNYHHHIVVNPAFLPIGMDYDDYMKICFACIDVCDAVFFLDGWENSRGSIMEMEYAKEKQKQILYEEI